MEVAADVGGGAAGANVTLTSIFNRAEAAIRSGDTDGALSSLTEIWNAVQVTWQYFF